MKKLLSLISCIAIFCLVLAGCGSTKEENVSTALGDSVKNLKNSLNNVTIYNSEDLMLPQNENFDNVNLDYNRYNNQVYNQNFESAKYENVSAKAMNARANRMSTNNYVNDNNQPTSKYTTSEYRPRYTSRVSNTSATVNNIELLTDLFTICNDTACANDLLSALKRSLLNDCDTCLNLIKSLNSSNCTNQQCDTLYNYCNQLNSCCNTINSTCNIADNVNTANIRNMKNNVATNCDSLISQYLKILNCIDCNIGCMTTANTLLSEINDYICSITGKCSINNSYATQTTSKYVNNFYRPRYITTITGYRETYPYINQNTSTNTVYDIRDEKPEEIRSENVNTTSVPTPHSNRPINNPSRQVTTKTTDIENLDKNSTSDKNLNKSSTPEESTQNSNVNNLANTSNVKPLDNNTSTEDKTYAKQTKLEDNKNVDNTIVTKTPANTVKATSRQPEVKNVRA